LTYINKKCYFPCMTLKIDLCAIPLFQGLEPQYRALFADIAIEREFGRGRTIFSEGDPGTGFYVVASGRIKIFKLSSDGKEQILHIFGPGEPFGEAPVFSGKKFPANAEAIEKSRILYFPRDRFVDLVQNHPALALSIMAVLSERLHRFTDLVEQLSLKEVPGRLAAYFLYLSEHSGGQDTLDLDISKSQLASVLGTVPETFSRILGKMSKEGVISTDGKRSIRIMDRTGLEELADGTRRLS